jgi:hypothetical protein
LSVAAFTTFQCNVQFGTSTAQGSLITDPKTQKFAAQLNVSDTNALADVLYSTTFGSGNLPFNKSIEAEYSATNVVNGPACGSGQVSLTLAVRYLPPGSKVINEFFVGCGRKGTTVTTDPKTGNTIISTTPGVANGIPSGSVITELILLAEAGGTAPTSGQFTVDSVNLDGRQVTYNPSSASCSSSL